MVKQQDLICKTQSCCSAYAYRLFFLQEAMDMHYLHAILMIMITFVEGYSSQCGVQAGLAHHQSA